MPLIPKQSMIDILFQAAVLMGQRSSRALAPSRIFAAIPLSGKAPIGSLSHGRLLRSQEKAKAGGFCIPRYSKSKLCRYFRTASSETPSCSNLGAASHDQRMPGRSLCLRLVSLPRACPGAQSGLPKSEPWRRTSRRFPRLRCPRWASPNCKVCKEMQ